MLILLVPLPTSYHYLKTVISFKWVTSIPKESSVEGIELLFGENIIYIISNRVK